MALWETTHGKARGCYLKAGPAELYVRQVLTADGVPTGRWQLFVDGQLEGEADGEVTARAAAELAVRCMVDDAVAGRACCVGSDCCVPPCPPMADAQAASEATAA